MKKIAITRSGKDLLRIIPFDGNEDTIDLKIALLKNEYSIHYWSLDDTTPIKKETSSEITYHSSEANGSKSSKVQIKENEDNYTFTFNKVIDAKLNSEFPIPIFKLGIKDNSGRIYKKKKKHVTIDLDTVSTKAVNTIEVYLAEKSFDYIKFSKKWPNFSGLLTICSIDYLVKGFAPSKQVYNAIFGEGGPIPLLQAIPFNDFRLFYKVYFDKSIKENCLSFYENRHYIDMLATTPVALQYKNGEYSKILPAYVRDLRIQESNGAKPRELKKWAKFFKSSEERIKSPQNRCGVILPQG